MYLNQKVKHYKAKKANTARRPKVHSIREKQKGQKEQQYKAKKANTVRRPKYTKGN